MSLIDIHSTLPASCYAFLNFLAKKGRRQATIKRYLYDLEDFFRWLLEEKGEPYQFSNITNRDIKKYFHMLKTERSYQVRTMKRVETVLKQFFQYLVNEREISESPVTAILSKKNVSNQITDRHLLSKREQEQLLTTLASLKNLTENQQKARPLLMKRNVAIVTLLLKYGLSLKEVAQLTMEDVSFTKNKLFVHSSSSLSRTIELEQEDKVLLFEYIQTISEAVRPRLYSDDPLFIAFDFQRNTYRWQYELDKPKALTEIAIQKMIRLEVKRAGLRKGISAQHLRHTYAINALKSNVPQDIVRKNLGMKTPFGLKKYVDYLNQKTS